MRLEAWLLALQLQLLPSWSHRFFHSEQEAQHVGAAFPDPEIVTAFRSSPYGRDPLLDVNDMLGHHALIKLFCQLELRKQREEACTWREYYSLLNFMRKPFNGVYDPGMDKAGRAASAMDPPRECEVIQRPSAKQFLSYVEKNRPFVIRGEGKRWKAYKRWNKRYLLNKIGDSTVTISLSEKGDFVGPEPLDLWEGVRGADPAVESTVLARPASGNMPFSRLVAFYDKYMQERRINASAVSPSLYMEYTPIAALHTANLMDDVRPFYWSHILNPKLMLLWLGGGGSRKNGRLHFDNYENLMTVILGRKTFMLFSPAQSFNLYADQLMRSASLAAEYAVESACGASDDCTQSRLGNWRFRRLAENVHESASRIHTYSPVDVLNPDFDTYPLLRQARGFNCTLDEGDMIYVPSTWWHEVVTHDNEEGLSLGVNYFFDPFYIRRRDTRTVYLHESRMYSHIRPGSNQTARACTGEHVCFKSSAKRKRRRKKSARRRKTEL